MLKRMNIFIVIFSILLLCGCDKKEKMANAEMNPKFHNLPPEVQNELREEVESGSMTLTEAEAVVENGGNSPDINTETELAADDGANLEGWSQEKSDQAQRIADMNPLTINGKSVKVAESGYCARGVANILLKMGYPVTRGDAHDWDTTLPQKGWKKISCKPASCPAGSVLQFESNAHRGSGPLVTGGEKWGHVEIVTENRDGTKKFCSDACRGLTDKIKPEWGGLAPDNKRVNRPGWGGTVPANYAGAWVYEGNTND